jgi:hypothetical protein
MHRIPEDGFNGIAVIIWDAEAKMIYGRLNVGRQL